MEENLEFNESDFTTTSEPNSNENSQVSKKDLAEMASVTDEKQGQSLNQDPKTNLLLGKFKSVEELSKAYEELQKRQGFCSEELGSLRKQVSEMNGFKQQLEDFNTIQTQFNEIVSRDRAKYNTPEYFQDPTFCEIYKEALITYKENLDTDRLVNLLDAYANARIFANDKKKSAINETQQVLDSMTYSKNPKSSLTPPKKRFDEMTEKEIDEMLEKLI